VSSAYECNTAQAANLTQQTPLDCPTSTCVDALGNAIASLWGSTAKDSSEPRCQPPRARREIPLLATSCLLGRSCGRPERTHRPCKYHMHALAHMHSCCQAKRILSSEVLWPLGAVVGWLIETLMAATATSPLRMRPTQRGDARSRSGSCEWVLQVPATGEQCQYEDCPTSTCADAPGGAHSTPLESRRRGVRRTPLPQTMSQGASPPATSCLFGRPRAGMSSPKPRKSPRAPRHTCTQLLSLRTPPRHLAGITNGTLDSCGLHRH
jgi:hypothetical protein